MPHVLKDKDKLLARIKRIQGQLNSVGLGIKEEKECGIILQTLAASRGAINSLTAEILEDHIRSHVIPSSSKWKRENEEAAEEAIEVIRSYLV